MAAFSLELHQNDTNLYRKDRYSPVSVHNDPDWQNTITWDTLAHIMNKIEKVGLKRVEKIPQNGPNPPKNQREVDLEQLHSFVSVRNAPHFQITVTATLYSGIIVNCSPSYQLSSRVAMSQLKEPRFCPFSPL